MRADWKDLPAGPELDALVATEVMGWQPLSYTIGGFLVIDSREHNHRDGADNYWRDDEGFEVAVEAWKPSSEIVTAWQVIEKMEAHGFACSISRYVDPDDGGHWTAHLSGFGARHGIRFQHTNETPMLAICRAATAAMHTETEPT